MLQGKENKEKSDTSFKEWINKEKEGTIFVPNQSDFKKTHYIPDVDLGFTKFKQFYESRKELLRNEIKTKIND